jgi:hypothetical protein
MVMSSGSSFPVLKVEEEVWSDDRTLAFAPGATPRPAMSKSATRTSAWR